jgi:putative thioredoxin
MNDKNKSVGLGYGADISGEASLAGGVEPNISQHGGTSTAGSFASMGSAAEAPAVKDISTAEFMTEVIQASQQLPVLVDFWAPWCGPCKQLAPALEAAVAKAAGKVKLVKMNIDEHPEVAGQMGIQSIPAVVAFMDGQPRDAFMGNKAPAEIGKFIEKLIGPSGPSQLDMALEQAQALLDEEAYAQAGQIFGAILQQSPDNEDAIAGFGMAALRLGHRDEAKKALASASLETKHAGLAGLRTAIELAEKAENLGELPELQNGVTADPDDHEKRFELALALNARGKSLEAAEQLLEIVRRDREWRDDGAKAELLKFFEAWGPTDPATLSARRRLSSMLFS